jgi:hypothetical protein
MIPLTEMLRIFALLPIFALAVSGQDDPVFKKVPFDDWLKGGEDARIRFTLRALPARLSAHQRMAVLLRVEVDGGEFVKRPKSGQVVVFLEIRDRDGRVYRTHRSLTFEESQKTSDLAAIHFEQSAFMTPGDYQVAAAVYDALSKEHSLKQMKLHVSQVPKDPLPGAWRDIPAVEFVPLSDPPDRWFLPEITSKLYLPLRNEKPVRIEVVVNESPTENAMRRTGRVSTRNMGNLVPALKVISQIEVQNGSIDVTLLDLERRKVSFAQEEVKTLDWEKLKAALIENDPNKIDVHALENHEQNAQFFVSEIRKRLEKTETNGDVPLGLEAEPKKVLIVLSGPMAFPKGQDLRPIEAAPEPGSKVFYIRYLPPRPGPSPGMVGRGGRGISPPMQMPPRGPSTEDSLARTLKPLAPRVFDVTNPMEFRSALASIITEISALK